MAASSRQMTTADVLTKVFADRDSDFSDKSEGESDHVSVHNGNSSGSKDDHESGEARSKVSINVQGVIKCQSP